MRKIIFSSLCVLLVFSASAILQATTVSFTPASSGSLGSSTHTYGVPGIVATAYYWNGSAWVTGVSGLSLYGRNESGEHGIGVCDPSEFSNGTNHTNLCGTAGGNGDYNELSNKTKKELIQLTLPTNYSWVSVQLSSLDKNSSTDSALFERGTIWASNGAFGSAGSVVICNYVAGGATSSCFGTTSSGEPTVNIGSSFANYKYLYFQPNDWSAACVTNNNCNNNNDVLIEAASVLRTPEPASLALLGAGLLGLVARRKSGK